MPRGEHIRQGSDIIHCQRTLPSVATRIHRRSGIHQRHPGPVEAGQTAGRHDHSLRAQLPHRKRTTEKCGRGLRPVRVHGGTLELWYQIRGDYANSEYGWHEQHRSRPRSVHERRR